MADKILDVENLTISFKTDNGLVRAVRGVSFNLEKGETLCIVGESGSGKSVTSKAIMGILANNAVIDGGKIMYNGENLLEVSEEEFHRIRGNKIGMIFQDPLSSLNPIVRIGHQITEAMLINSDKLKQMKNDIISKEQAEYTNLIARRRIHIKHEKDVYQIIHGEVNKILKDKALPEQQKQEAKQKLNDAKAHLKQRIAEINSECNEKKPALKQALQDKKAYADEQIKEYTDKLNAEFDKYTQDWTERYNKVNLDPKRIEDDAKYSELEKELEKQIKEIKFNYKKENLKAKSDYLMKNKAKFLTLFKFNSPERTKIKSDKKVAFAEIDEEINKKADEEIKKLHEAFDAKNASLKESVTASREQLQSLKNEYNAEHAKHISYFKVTKKEAKKRALEVMAEVGIPLPEKRFKQYPFEFSGGMRQRIVIAIALIATPEILICDEPTTALDVTIQAQILELIKKIQKEHNISCIFITHDLGVVANMANRVAVMYAGKIVEYGTVDEIFFEPKHPYTWALLSSIPDVDSKERLEAIPGTPPNMIYPPKGDAFALRSKYAMKIDFEQEPPYFKISDTHYAATWLLHPNAPKVEMPKIVSTRIANAMAQRKEVKEASANE